MSERHEIVRKHLAMLFDAGHSHRTVGEATGISKPMIGSMIYRDDRPISQASFDAVMSLEVRPPWETPGVILRDRMLVPGVGTIRRLQAVARMGYPLPRVAEVIGVSEVYLQVLVNADITTMVYARTDREVKRFYQMALVNIPRWKSSERTRRWAEGKGWHGAGAWDDIDRDERPDPGGNVFVIAEYVRDEPGFTTLGLQDKIRRDLGIPGTVAGRLIKEALEAGAIERVRNHRHVRVYATG